MITRLNKTASEVLQRFEVRAATDVTGFGLGGHAYEMATGSDVTLEIAMGSVPVMAEALEMYERGVSTGVNGVNRQNIQYATDFGAANESQQELLVDPQTSGGLLIAIPPEDENALSQALARDTGRESATIGRIKALTKPLITVLTDED